MSKIKLSLCIATFNEEKFIHYPLDSAYDLSDEVVIVDGGSEDKTIDSAKSYGDKVRVIETDNPKMFHKNKQKAINAAQGEWILQLDADEAISKDLKKEIKKVITNLDNNEEKHVGYRIPRKNWFLSRFLTKGGIYPDYTIRLYKNGKAIFPCKDVHENVEVDGEVGTLKNDILHYADPTFERYLSRWNRYTTLDAIKLKKQNKKPSFLSYFIFKPISTFFSIYFRHKGFQDGFPGFVWALFSSIRYWVVYIKHSTLQF